MTDIYKMNMNLISDSNMYSQCQPQVESRFHLDLSSSMSVTTDIYKMNGKYQPGIRLRFTLRFHTSISILVVVDIERSRWNLSCN